MSVGGGAQVNGLALGSSSILKERKVGYIKTTRGKLVNLEEARGYGSHVLIANFSAK